jgi:hypothetical protein
MASKEDKLIKEAYDLSAKLIANQRKMLKVNGKNVTPATVIGNIVFIVVDTVNTQIGINESVQDLIKEALKK